MLLQVTTNKETFCDRSIKRLSSFTLLCANLAFLSYSSYSIHQAYLVTTSRPTSMIEHEIPGVIPVDHFVWSAPLKSCLTARNLAFIRMEGELLRTSLSYSPLTNIFSFFFAKVVPCRDD